VRKTPRGTVGNVAQTLCGLGDGGAGARGDSRIVRQGAGDRRHGEARRLRDGAQRRFLVARKASGLSRFRAPSAVFARKLRCRAFCSVFKRFNTHAAPRCIAALQKTE
jgi:hypothetical protein